MLLESSVFRSGEMIPIRHTGEGEDVSPPFEWCNVPENCKSFALICEDVDTKIQPHWDTTFVHWLLYNIPADVRSVPEGLDASEDLSTPFSAQQGTNSFGKTGYSGPMPPIHADEHHYVFQLVALDADLELPSGLMLAELRRRMQGHILKSVELVGKYKRQETAVGYDQLKPNPGAEQRL